MDSQKRENILNLALNATPRELEQSLVLDAGFEEETQLWEVIVRYDIGVLDEAEENREGLWMQLQRAGVLKDRESEQKRGIRVVELLGGYGILTLTKSQILKLSEIPEITYMEMPKRLFFSVDKGRTASCISPLQSSSVSGRQKLLGNGVLVAVLDSGIDYFHPDFRNRDGSSRILRIWDQTAAWQPDQIHLSRYQTGREYTKEQIDQALEQSSREEALQIVPVTDGTVSGHGTAVASIAAGNGRGSQGEQYRGVAPESSLLIVKVGTARENGFPRTTELMMAVDYALRTAAELQMPVAINISIGNNYGSHDGTSLLETYLNTASDTGRAVICVGTGNEGTSRAHVLVQLEERQQQEVEFSISTYETGLTIQLWKYYTDRFFITLISPSGAEVGPFQQELGTQQFRLEQTKVLLYYGEPAPYTQAQEVFLDFLPQNSYLNTGVWKIRFTPERIVVGEVNLWLPGSGAVNFGTGFLMPTPDITLTIPSTAEKVISVAAYDTAKDAYADFSGRGFTRVTNRVKPDLAAPGVGIMSASVGGGYGSRSGTSFATPFVTGSAALLMEWGIVQGRDAYLYGEKVKAYLIKGARELPGFAKYPNPQVGWGVLCLKDSLPI
ncbi:MAG: S8 family serine peptidase [Lachnospiraceae bacterium]|nr:S8 family serine peptidase [Lachnospiraceae bacterium]